MVEMAATEASLRSVASQPFRIYMSVSLCLRQTARHGLCGFDYLTLCIKEKNRTDKSLHGFFGGDGGSRNRVRKSLPATFYERSH